jgi:carboxylesterase type B
MCATPAVKNVLVRHSSNFFRTATEAKMGFIIRCSATLALFASSILLQPSNVLAQISTNSSSGPVVDLGYAQYQGNTTLRSNYSTDVYYGIRFAQAPVGKLRWQPPQNIEAHNDYNPSEVIDAQTPSPSCVQGTPAWQLLANQTGPVPVTGQEDCLLLDVYVPEKPVSTALPVLVNIHGGGYTQGSAAGNAWQALVNTSQGSIIYVSTQYRLGAYGFLSSAEVRENGQANAGLLDQRSALEWIQRNIRSFGGDPAKVTIIGGSAGGGSVMDQMIMYGGVASPPFRAVISEYPWWQPFHNNTILEGQYRDLLSAADCSNIQCLRNLNETALKAATQLTYLSAYRAQPLGIYGFGDFYYGPSVDGDIIRDLPSNEWKQAHFTKVPLLVDRDGYEGFYFSNQSELTTAGTTMDLQELFPYAKQHFFDRLYQLYPTEAFNSTFWQRQTLFGDFIINCPTYYMASAMADEGVPTYKLIFNAGTQKHGATGTFAFESNDSPSKSNLSS